MGKDIRDTVRKQYGEIASKLKKGGTSSCCCTILLHPHY